MTAPARRRLAATVESCEGGVPTSASEPAICLHPVGRVDVALDEDRNAVQRPAHVPGLSLGVEVFRNSLGVGIQLENGVHASVENVDPRLVLLNKGKGCRAP